MAILIGVTMFGFIDALTAARKAKKNRVKNDGKLIKEFRDNIRDEINRAIDSGYSSTYLIYITQFEAVAKEVGVELSELGYGVSFSEINNLLKISISWGGVFEKV